MPLVRISFLKGKPRGFGKDVASVVYRTMVDTINVPPKDNFQELGVRLEDVFVNLVEVKRENWSFGNGIAQYAGS